MKNNKKVSSKGRRTGRNSRFEENTSSKPDKSFDFKGSSSNHPSWYKVNEQLAKDTASIPFGYALGSRKDHGGYGDLFNDYSVAGVMRINYMPTYGHLDNITAPINIAARNIYTNLKSVNSRAKTYDAPDIAIYLMAIDSLISFHEWMKRIYGIMNTASITNRYVAEAITRAAGGDYNDILSNINDFRAYINKFALRISTLPLPANMSIFARHAWMNSHVWYDSENVSKAQTYVFSPTGFWKYGLDADGAGRMEYQVLEGALGRGKSELSFADITTLGEELLSAVLYGAGDEDFNIMAGDILYAYGESNLFRATTIEEHYAVIPEYQAWVCDQINNLRCYGPADDSSNFISQDADKRYLEHTVTVTLPVAAKLGDNTTVGDFLYPWNNAVMDQYVNIFDSDTSSDHVLVATRLTAIPIAVGENFNRVFEFLGLASEYVENFCVYYYATLTGQSGAWQLYRSGLATTISCMFDMVKIGDYTPSEAELTDICSANIGVADLWAQLSSFDRKPLQYAIQVRCMADSGRIFQTTSKYIPHAYIDLNNYSIVSYSTMKQMNDAALLAMFGIDEFGKQISLSK